MNSVLIWNENWIKQLLIHSKALVSFQISNLYCESIKYFHSPLEFRCSEQANVCSEFVKGADMAVVDLSGSVGYDFMQECTFHHRCFPKCFSCLIYQLYNPTLTLVFFPPLTIWLNLIQVLCPVLPFDIVLKRDSLWRIVYYELRGILDFLLWCLNRQYCPFWQPSHKHVCEAVLS